MIWFLDSAFLEERECWEESLHWDMFWDKQGKKKNHKLHPWFFDDWTQSIASSLLDCNLYGKWKWGKVMKLILIQTFLGLGLEGVFLVIVMLGALLCAPSCCLFKGNLMLWHFWFEVCVNVDFCFTLISISYYEGVVRKRYWRSGAGIWN